MSDQSTPVVETSSGKVRGAIIEGVAAFKAVPYAAPPTGARRFLPPREPGTMGWHSRRDGLCGPRAPGRIAHRHSPGT